MNEVMMKGVELMLTGMGIVFLFLVLLIGSITLMSAFVAKFFPDAAIQPAPINKPPTANNNSEATTAAITAAVHQHRAK